jgi:hypothetical protein
MAGRAQYTVQVGKKEITFEGPSGLNEAQIEQLADTHLKDAMPGQTFPHAQLVGPDSQEHSMIGSFARNLPHDALMNFDDEIAAAGNAVIPGMASLDNASGLNEGSQGSIYDSGSKGFWDTFNKNLDALQQTRKADDEQHPMASSAGRVLGMLSVLPRAGSAVFSRMPQVVRSALEAHPIISGAAVGGGTGAVSGAGAGRGNRGQSAAIGAGLGGAIEAAPAISSYVKLLFNKGQVATERALNAITTALRRDGYDVADPNFAQSVRSAIQEYTGKPVTLADLGRATRSRAGVALRTPSDQQIPAIDTITQRNSGAGARLASDVRHTVAPRTDVHALDEALTEQRAQEAAKLRERALFQDTQVEPTTPRPTVQPRADDLDAGVRRTLGQDVPETFERVPATTSAGPLTQRTSRIVEDPELQQLARLPMAQQALKAALQQAEGERGLLATTGQSIDHLPDLNAGSNLDMRTFDYLKRFLDDEVNRLYKRGDTQTFSAQQANQVKALRNAIRDRLKAVNPEYARYLDQYAGSSEMIDALGEGRTFQNLDPEEIAAGQAGRSTAAQELYRVGAARSLLDDIRGARDTGQNPAYRVLNNDTARDQLAATGVTPANAARLNRSVAQERTLALLPRELTGSDTAARQIAQQDADVGSLLQVPGNVLSQGRWFGNALNAVLNKVAAKRSAAVNEALLPRLVNTDPRVIDATINELVQHGRIAEARALQRARTSAKIAAGLGVNIGGPVALPAGDQ